jgi:hypothetical protein
LVCTNPLEPFGTGGSHLDPVSRRGERLAHLRRDYGRVIVDEQQVGHGSLRLLGCGQKRRDEGIVAAVAWFVQAATVSRFHPRHRCCFSSPTQG